MCDATLKASDCEAGKRPKATDWAWTGHLDRMQRLQCLQLRSHVCGCPACVVSYHCYGVAIIGLPDGLWTGDKPVCLVLVWVR